MSMNQKIGPNIIHPETPSAVGSRNSLNRDGRDEYAETGILVNEEVDKILNHVTSKLPPEVLEKLDIHSTIKEKIHGYYNQSFQNLLNRYLTTVEDEFAKKVRKLVDQEEYLGLNKYSPSAVSTLMESIGGSDKFNTEELDKSIINIYGHLQGSIQRAVFNLEQETNAILRQKTDVGAFIRGQNTYTIARCSFKDNKDKPINVVDVKLSLNVLDSELISPVLHVRENPSIVIKSIISDHIISILDREVKAMNEKMMDDGKEDLDESQKIFEKIKLLEEYTGADVDNPNSNRYKIVQKNIIEALDTYAKDTQVLDSQRDHMTLKYNALHVLEAENIKNRGYNSAVNAITSILDLSKMGYQHIENMKNARHCVIREYSTEEQHQIPDENYFITMTHYDNEQISTLREDYERYFKIFKSSFEEVISVIEVNYIGFKKAHGIIDYSDVLGKYRRREEIQDIKKFQEKESWLSKIFGGSSKPAAPSVDGEEVGEIENTVEEDLNRRLWNEFVFIAPEATSMTSKGKKYDVEIQEIKEKIIHCRSRLGAIYSKYTPEERSIIENRINYLEDLFNEFSTRVNPYHLQPGICIEIVITSVKRKQTTVLAMANVLNEFLYSISKGFQDAAFADFQRRRSTIKKDLDAEFVSFVD